MMIDPPRPPGNPRERLAEAGRYSRFVALMRYALPAAAVVLGLVLLTWPGANGDLRNLPRTTMGQREMINPVYKGLNRKGEHVEVHAERAVQVGDVADVVTLEKISATLTRTAGGRVSLTANGGRYDQRRNHLFLEGQVHIVDDTGYDLVTETAQVDLNTPSRAWGTDPVSGRGPKGAIRGNGFRITDEGKTIVLTGRSRLDLNNGSAP